MSTKPSTVATWGGTILTPSAGKQAAGFVPSERPPAQYLDWLFNLAGQWQQYLSDGDCTFHNLTATGAAAFLAGVGMSGSLTMNGATSGAITHAIPAVITPYTLTWPSAAPTSRCEVHVSATGQIDFGASDRLYVSAANAQLTSVGLAAGSPATFDGGAWFLAATTTSQGPVFDIPLTPGKTLSQVRVYGTKNSATGTIVMTARVRNAATGATVATITASNGTNAPGNIVLSSTTSPLPLAILDDYVLTVQVDGGGINGPDSIRGAAAYYT